MDEYKKKISSIVGNNIRIARHVAGLSQKSLAEKLYFTYQQLAKYERGEDQIPFYRLCYIADTLSKDISYFRNETQLFIDHNETISIKLMHNFRKIKNKHSQEAIICIVKELAEKEKE